MWNGVRCERLLDVTKGLHAEGFSRGRDWLYQELDVKEAKEKGTGNQM